MKPLLSDETRAALPKTIAVSALALALLFALLLPLLALSMKLDNQRIMANIASSFVDTKTSHPQGMRFQQWLSPEPLTIPWMECKTLTFGVRPETEGTSAWKEALRASYVNCGPLRDIVANGKPLTADMLGHYGRYWHGYGIITRPLLYAVSYADAVGVLLVTLVLLAALSLALSTSIAELALLLGIFASMAAMKGWNIGVTMSFTYLWLVPIAAILFMQLRRRRLHKQGKDTSLSMTTAGVMFAVCGALTSYFDRLTVPLATFCVPMMYLVATSLASKTPDYRLNQLPVFLFALTSWCFGYFGFWTLKFVAIYLLNGTDIIAEVQNRIDVHTSARGRTEEAIGRFQGIYENIRYIPRTYIEIVAAMTAVATIFQPGRELLKRCFGQGSGMLLTMLLPLVWLALFTHHSIVHVAFTKDQLLLVGAPLVTCGVYALLMTLKNQAGVYARPART